MPVYRHASVAHVQRSSTAAFITTFIICHKHMHLFFLACASGVFIAFWTRILGSRKSVQPSRTDNSHASLSFHHTL